MMHQTIGNDNSKNQMMISIGKHHNTPMKTHSHKGKLVDETTLMKNHHSVGKTPKLDIYEAQDV